MIQVDVRIVSFGGVGCTYIIKKVQDLNIITNHIFDRDIFKHPHYSSNINQGIEAKKTIYVYNDPMKAVLSHYRRKWQIGQHNKITCSDHRMNSDVIRFFNVLQDKTIEMGEDIYGVERHFYSWYEKEKNNKDFIFIDFREQCDDKVSNFINAKIKFKLKERSPILEILKDDFVAIYYKLDQDIRKHIGGVL